MVAISVSHYSQLLAVNPLNLRIGIGHDTHRLIEGGTLWLGGVEVEHTHSLDGHSDADVLLHAVTDAILGAAALGDIGEMFPNTDQRNAGRDSAEMLSLAARSVRESGFEFINLDCIVFAQTPKLSSYKKTIADRVASVLGISADRVGVKAKTGEGVGTVGRCEVMKAQCVALLYKND